MVKIRFIWNYPTVTVYCQDLPYTHWAMVVVAATVSLLTFRILKHKDIGICGWPVISRPWEIVLLSFKGVLCLKCNWFQGIMESFFFSHKRLVGFREKKLFSFSIFNVATCSEAFILRNWSDNVGFNWMKLSQIRGSVSWVN